MASDRKPLSQLRTELLANGGMNIERVVGYTMAIKNNKGDILFTVDANDLFDADGMRLHDDLEDMT